MGKEVTIAEVTRKNTPRSERPGGHTFFVQQHWGQRKEKVIFLGTFRGSCDLQKRNKNSATGCPLSTQGALSRKWCWWCLTVVRLWSLSSHFLPRRNCSATTGTYVQEGQVGLGSICMGMGRRGEGYVRNAFFSFRLSYPPNGATDMRRKGAVSQKSLRKKKGETYFGQKKKFQQKQYISSFPVSDKRVSDVVSRIV